MMADRENTIDLTEPSSQSARSKVKVIISEKFLFVKLLTVKPLSVSYKTTLLTWQL